MIPGLETREFWMAVFVVIFAVFGCLVHYFYHKSTTTALKTVTIKSVFRKTVVGLGAGILLILGLAGFSVNILALPHIVAAGVAFTTGISAETLIGKWLGMMENK